jgi:hypothetical protein
MTKQDLFNYLHDQHGIILTESEMDEILRICKEIDNEDFEEQCRKAEIELCSACRFGNDPCVCGSNVDYLEDDEYCF